MKDKSCGNGDSDGQDSAPQPIWINAKRGDRQACSDSDFAKDRSGHLIVLSCQCSAILAEAASALAEVPIKPPPPPGVAPKP
jgi:hypothetical protein